MDVHNTIFFLCTTQHDLPNNFNFEECIMGSDYRKHTIMTIGLLFLMMSLLMEVMPVMYRENPRK
jgi:hypothetical protein